MYHLEVAPLCCNKFGLAELFVNCYGKLSVPSPNDVLDVGCGAGPLGIYFADQFTCNVIGVELNPIACACCEENLEKLGLQGRFRLVRGDFRQLDAVTGASMMFDLIVSVPPLDIYVPPEKVQKYVKRDFQIIDAEAFAYLTNSWHDEEYNDLLDLIFHYGQTHLRQDGRIITSFCLIDCNDPSYVIRKAESYHYTCVDQVESSITTKSIGVGDTVPHEISAFVMNFRMKKGTYHGDSSS